MVAKTEHSNPEMTHLFTSLSFLQTTAGWHHWLHGHDFEQTPGDSKGQGSLVCCRPWGRRELDTTEWTATTAGVPTSGGGRVTPESKCHPLLVNPILNYHSQMIPKSLFFLSVLMTWRLMRNWTESILTMSWPLGQTQHEAALSSA